MFETSADLPSLTLYRQEKDDSDRRSHLCPRRRFTNRSSITSIFVFWSLDSWSRSRLPCHDHSTLPSRTGASGHQRPCHGASTIHVGYWCTCGELGFVCHVYIHTCFIEQPVASISWYPDHPCWIPGHADPLVPGVSSVSIGNIPLNFISASDFHTSSWLIDHGQNERGLETLAKLHAHGDQNDAWVRAEYDQIQDMITFEHEHEAKSYTELFTNRSSFRRLLLACSIQASVQMTGVSAIQYYSPEIFKQIGIPGSETLKYQGISSIIALVAQLCCILLIDYTGRRWAMIGGNLGNLLTFIIATILLAKFPPGATDNNAASWAFIVITWIYNFSFSATNGPLSWIVPAEIFDTRTRSKGVSIATMTSFAFNTMIGQG